MLRGRPETGPKVSGGRPSLRARCSRRASRARKTFDWLRFSSPAPRHSVLGMAISDDERRAVGLERARDAVLARYLAFTFNGWSLEEWDLGAEVAQMCLGPVQRMPGQFSLRIIKDDDDVGAISRTFFYRGDDLIAGHRQFRIHLEGLRRHGFGTALNAAAVAWYREVGIAAILQSAEGDGSLWAARHGYDFDIEAYRDRRACSGLDEVAVRGYAVADMLRRPGVLETVPGDQAPRRESVRELLDRVSQTKDGRAAVEDFMSRVPVAGQPSPEDALLSPSAIAEFGRSLEELGGSSLGRELLRRTSWSGIKLLQAGGV